jgi:hypothetical protein
MKNRAHHHGKKHSPYEAMFGTHPKIDLTPTILPVNIIEELRTEEELQAEFKSIQILSNDNEHNEIFQKIEEYDEVKQKQGKY